MASDKDLEIRIGIEGDNSGLLRTNERYLAMLNKAIQGAEKLLAITQQQAKAQEKVTSAVQKEQNERQKSRPSKAEVDARRGIDFNLKSADYLPEQVQARAAQAAASAAERLVRVTNAALVARLNKASLDAETLVARFATEARTAIERQKRELAQANDAFRFSGAGQGAGKTRVDINRAEFLSDFGDASKATFRSVSRRLNSDQRLYERAGLNQSQVDGAYEKGGRAGVLALAQEALAQLAVEKEATNVRKRRLADIKRAADEEARANRETYKNSAEGVRAQVLAENQRKHLRETARRDLGLTPPTVENSTPVGSSFSQRFARRAETASDYFVIGTAFAGAGMAVNEVLKLDDALARFSGITQTSQGEMVKFRSELLGVAKDSRASVSELAEVSIVLGQTGLSAKEVSTVLRPVSQLALAAGSSLKETTDVLTGAMGAFQLDSTRVTEVANVMAAALNQTKLNMQQLALGIQYAGNISSDAGISFTELTAILGTMANSGIRNGSTLGTGVRQLIQDLISPSEKLKASLKDLNISFAEIDVKSNGLVGVLENLKAKGFGTAEALRTMDLRAASAFSALSKGTDQAKKLQEVLLLTNASAEAAAKAGESLYAVGTRLGNNFIALLDTGLAPTVEGLKILGNVVSSILGPLTSLVGGVGGLGLSVAALGAGFAFSLGPIALAALGIGVLTTAIGYFGTTSDAAVQKLDKLSGALNEVKGKQSSTENTLSSLDRSIDNLIVRQDRLKQDPILLRTAIIEAQKAFGKWGLTIDTNVGSVDRLVEALQKLRGELKGELPGVLDRQVILGRDRVRILEDQFLGDKANETRQSHLGALTNKLQREGGDRLRATTNFLQTDRSSLLLSDPRTISGPAFSEIRKEQLRLEGEVEKTTDPSQLARLKRDLAQLTEAFAYIDNVVQALNTIQGEKRQLGITQQGASVARVQDQLTPFKNKVDGLEQFQVSGLQGIARQYNTTASSSEVVKQSDNLKEAVRERARVLLEELDSEEKRLLTSGVDKDAVQSAVKEYRDTLTALQKFGTSAVKGAEDEIKNILETMRRFSERKVQAQIKRAETQSSEAKTEEALSGIEGQLNQYFSELARIRQDQLKARLEKEGTLSQKEQNLYLGEESSRTEEERQSALSRLRRKSSELLNKQLGLQERVLKRKISDIGDEISNLQKDLSSKQTPLSKLGELRDKIDRLIADRLNLMNQQVDIEAARHSNNNLDGRASSGNPNAVYTPTGAAPPGSVARQVADYFIGIGRPDLVRYALAVGIQESNLNPSAKNPTPGQSSGGLFGFTDGTFRRSGQDTANKFDVGANNSALLKLITGEEGIFRNSFNRGPSDQERYLLHQFGSGDGLKLLRARENGQGGSSARDFLNDPEAVFKANPGLGSNSTVDELIKKIFSNFDSALRRSDVYAKDTGPQNKSADRLIEAQDRRATSEERRANVSEEAASEADEQRRQNLRRADRDKKEADDLLQKRNTDAAIADSRRREKELTREAATFGTQSRTLDDPSGVSTAIIRQLETNLQLRDQNLKTFNLDPANKEADAGPTLRASVEKAISEVLAGIERIGSAGTSKVRDQIKRLKDDLELADKFPGKFTPSEVREKQNQLRDLETQALVSSELNANLEQQRILTEALDRLRKEGVTDESTIERLLTKQTELKKLQAELQPRVSAISRENSPSNTFGSAYNKVFPQLNDTQQQKKDFEDLVSSLTELKNGLASAFQGLFSYIILNAKNAGEAFKKFGQSILQTAFNIISKRLSEQLVNSIFGGLGDGGGGFGSFLEGLFKSGAPLMNGGMVRAANGYGVPTRDSVPALLQPGEWVLRKSAVDAIGRENMSSLNAMGNTRVATPGPVAASMPKASPTPVNVWMVSKDQVPPPGPNDIVNFISDDIQRGGTTKQLIKQVMAGQI